MIVDVSMTREQLAALLGKLTFDSMPIGAMCCEDHSLDVQQLRSDCDRAAGEFVDLALCKIAARVRGLRSGGF